MSKLLLLLDSITTIVHLKQSHSHLITTSHPITPQTLTKLLHITSLSNPTDSSYALHLFNQIPTPTIFTYNSLLRSLSKCASQNQKQTLNLYKALLFDRVKPNGITFSFIAKACAHLKNLNFLMGIHGQLLMLGFHQDSLVLNSLIHGYLVCRSMDDARVVFDELLERDLISLTEVVNGYVRANRAKDAVELCFVMMEERVVLDEISVVAVFTACSQLGDLKLGRSVLGMVCKMGVRFNTYVYNSLIDMHAKCGSIQGARRLFKRMVGKDVVSWNSMVAAYAKYGYMKAAKKIFYQIPQKNEVSWSSFINGYIQNGDFKQALKVFQKIGEEGIKPNNAALTCAITACAHLGIRDLGRKIHLSLDESKLCIDVILSTAIVDMYIKCGDLDMARVLFDRIVRKNLVSWNVMLMGLAIHGNASECIELFSKMLGVNLKPDSVSFVALLSACAQAGWLKEGLDYFNIMSTSFDINPGPEHCSCIVHLMGQSGLLAEAFQFIKSSNVKPDAATWGALLSACKIHGNVELGEFVAERIFKLDPHHSGAYVQLSSLYASANKWREVARLRKRMKDTGVGNRGSWSCFELNGVIHEFSVRVKLHPRMKETRSLLRELELHITSSNALVDYMMPLSATSFG